MFIHNLEPVLLRLGPFQIRWYGLFFVLGFIIAYFMISHLAKKRKLNLSKNDVSDLMLYLIIGVVLGARVFYVFVYNLGFYMQNPLEIFAIWRGGLSFHGGLIGALAAGYYFCRKKEVNFYELADIAVIPLAIGLGFGRIGNFINGELFGRLTNVQWSVKFPAAEGFRHPSQIYESMKNFFIFFVLWVGKDKGFPRGFLFWLFVTLYGFLRFVIEFFREPDPQLGFFFGFLTMGQILSGLMLIVGGYFLYKIGWKAE